jgi:hypothetical protein
VRQCSGMSPERVARVTLQESTTPLEASEPAVRGVRGRLGLERRIRQLQDEDSEIGFVCGFETDVLATLDLIRPADEVLRRDRAAYVPVKHGDGISLRQRHQLVLAVPSEAQ